MEPLVSVVTPVYNGENTIEECIESVLGQNYPNFEYIIVDNQSKDRTLEIAKRFQQLDSRISIVKNDEFLPVMENLNKAMRQISPASKYCKMICADDWIYPEFLSQMVALAENNPNVGIVSSYRLMGAKVVPEEVMPYRKTIFSGREMSRMNLLDGPYTFGSPTALLYRSEIVFSREKFFNDERTSGDTEACYEILKSWDFGFVPQILSFNRLHEKSVTSTGVYLRKNLPDHLYMLEQYGEYFLSKDDFVKKEKLLLSDYYKFLGTSPKKLIDKKFREFHIESLKQVGLKLEWQKVFLGGLFEMSKSFVDVKSHVRKIVG
jgi:glycosyltransferase involved in cell wall biosynthesis